MPKDELRRSDAIGVKVSGVKVDIPDSPKMGLHSGYSEPKGRAPLTRPPKTRDLGIVEDDPRGWELKAKTIPTLRWAVVFNALSSQGSLIDNEEMGRIGRTSTTCSSRSLDGAAPLLYGRTRSGDTELMSMGEIPHTNISRADFDTIEGSETIEPLSSGESIRGWAVGYMIPHLRSGIEDQCGNLRSIVPV